MPARTEILTRLLDAHERSSTYGCAGPWRRDVILKFNHGTFPGAFAADGRDRHAELLQSTLELEQEGALRVERHHRGPLVGEPKSFRLGPAELSQAYVWAARLGYEPLSMGLKQLEDHALRLYAKADSPTVRSFLENLANALPAGDLSAIGVGRSKFKAEWRVWIPALTAAVALLRGVAPAWERVISETLFRDSKLLGRVRHHVISLLIRMDPRWDGVPVEDAADLLEVYGVRRKPGLIRCAGAARIWVGGREYRLEDFIPVAHLPDAWVDAWVEGLGGAGARLITTIENEYPFLSYVEQAGGPTQLGERNEVAVYTAGFPTPALVAGLIALRERISGLEFRHWGDADVGGLRIWWFLRCRIERPISLLRTTAGWFDSEVIRGGRQLTVPEVDALQRLKSQVSRVSGTDIPGALDLMEKLLEHRIRIEQERY